MPIACTGQVNSPRCIPDVGEIIKVAAQQAVQKKIGDVLQRAIGGGAAPQQQQQPAEPLTTDPSAEPAADPAQQQPQSPPVSPEQELINKALKSIFN